MTNMDDLLPSYESAIQRDPWILVAPCLSSDSIYSAALVCKRWHEIFTPHLWGSPASHFGVENDTVYGKLSRSSTDRTHTESRKSLWRASNAPYHMRDLVCEASPTLFNSHQPTLRSMEGPTLSGCGTASRGFLTYNVSWSMDFPSLTMQRF